MINTTPFTNTTGNFIIGIGTAINNESDGLFGLLILISFYIITFVSFSYNAQNLKGAFAGSTFIGVIIAILLRLLSWLNDTYLYAAIILAIIGLLVAWGGSDS